MDIVILSSMRLLGESLAACLNDDGISVAAVADSFSTLRETLGNVCIDVVLIDVSKKIPPEDIRAVALDWPRTALVAIGLEEHSEDVIWCGRAGFSGYVARSDSVATLRNVISDAAAGRLACPAEISGGLMRALFRPARTEPAESSNELLTRREEEVLRLIGNGLSNKEIARELNLSVATVKHHVHHILGKMNLPGRAQAMRKVRDQPWFAPASLPRKRSTEQ